MTASRLCEGCEHVVVLAMAGRDALVNKRAVLFMDGRLYGAEITSFPNMHLEMPIWEKVGVEIEEAEKMIDTKALLDNMTLAEQVSLLSGDTFWSLPPSTA
ncbi:hypothetical protein CO657_23940 (plasmid) [Rhizobium acidisoli]|uniref:Uncharacterized protein n=1 Tax=Rhizobium acidisoli TaxID=1538158 RepID=A0AAE6C3E4_9HYPH|nr:hypothetical protein CO657_23940 [Rhizobium acidisoli]